MGAELSVVLYIPPKSLLPLRSMVPSMTAFQRLVRAVERSKRQKRVGRDRYPY